MNNLPSRIVVGTGLAIIVSGLVAYGVHIASVPAPTAQVAPLAPPAPVVQTPEPPAAPAASAPTAEAPAAVATAEPAPATPAEPPPATTRKQAKALNKARITDDTVVAATPRVDSANSAAEARSSDDAKSADAAAPAPVPPAVAAATANQDATPVADTAVADSKITTEVKSILAADAVTKDADLNVNTTQGVVVLSGTLSSQDALDHVKVVAQNVPDVKRVDTSAVKVTTT